MSSETKNLPTQVGDTSTQHSSVRNALFAYAKRARDGLVYSSAYLVVVAIAMATTVTYGLSLSASPAIAVIGLVVFAVYVGDRIADVESDEASNPERSAFIRRYRRVLSILSAGAYGVAVALSVLGGPDALALTLLPGAFWILYASDWLPSTGLSVGRLKNVLLVNSALVAAGWVLAVVGLPLAFADAALTPAVAVVATYIFLDVFVNTEIPNVRDAAGDAAIGVDTLPVVLGVTRTRRVLYGLDGVLGAVLVVAAVQGVVPAAFAGAVLVGVAYAFGLAAAVGRSDHHELLAVAGEVEQIVVVLVLAGLVTVGV